MYIDYNENALYKEFLTYGYELNKSKVKIAAKAVYEFAMVKLQQRLEGYQLFDLFGLGEKAVEIQKIYVLFFDRTYVCNSSPEFYDLSERFFKEYKEQIDEILEPFKNTKEKHLNETEILKAYTAYILRNIEEAKIQGGYGLFRLDRLFDLDLWNRAKYKTLRADIKTVKLFQTATFCLENGYFSPEIKSRFIQKCLAGYKTNLAQINSIFRSEESFLTELNRVMSLI